MDSLKSQLWLIVEDNSTQKGRIFDYTIQFFILISLVAFSIETLPNNSQELKYMLFWVEVFCVTLFTLEYLCRIFVASHPLKYIFSFYGLIDLAAILPFYLALGFDLRSLRAFRVFRVFRSFKLIRYNKAIKRFQKAAQLVKEEIILFLIITAIFIFLAGVGIYFFENEAQPERFASVFHSLWWAVVTITTLGYGDVYPITAGGKIFTFFVLIVGVGVVTIPAGLVASALSRVREMGEEELNKKIQTDTSKTTKRL